MRDIRQDLRERLAEVEAQCAHHQRQVEALVEQERTLRALLNAEEARWPVQQPLIPGYETSKASVTKNGHSPLGRFLIERLATGGKTLPMLKSEAEHAGILLTSKHPGRALHFSLVGMARNGYVEKVNGVWQLK